MRSQNAIPNIFAKKQGFTLIELMITVAILALLAAIAFPSYTQYIVRGKRSAVQGFMMAVASKEQQYLLDARSYAATLGALNMAVPADVSPEYTITIATTATTYTITATPVAGSTQAGDGVLTLDNWGTKLPANKWKG